jgi:hypothetical protein
LKTEANAKLLLQTAAATGLALDQRDLGSAFAALPKAQSLERVHGGAAKSAKPRAGRAQKQEQVAV